MEGQRDLGKGDNLVIRDPHLGSNATGAHPVETIELPRIARGDGKGGGSPQEQGIPGFHLLRKIAHSDHGPTQVTGVASIPVDSKERPGKKPFAVTQAQDRPLHHHFCLPVVSYPLLRCFLPINPRTMNHPE
jgi:hypothetical protein